MTNEIKFDDLKYRREAEEFREVRARVQSAVRGIEVPGDLKKETALNELEAKVREAPHGISVGHELADPLHLGSDLYVWLMPEKNAAV